MIGSCCYSARLYRHVAEKLCAGFAITIPCRSLFRKRKNPRPRKSQNYVVVFCGTLSASYGSICPYPGEDSA